MKFINCILVAVGISSVVMAEESKKPNIIFLLTDDQTNYSVGAYGNKDVKTPETDRLAEDGVLFEKHYNTTAICMASRAIIFTGKYEYKTGTNFHKPVKKMKAQLWEQSYPVILRKNGYLTAFAGKFGMEVEEKQLCESDFDFWGGSPGQSDYQTMKNKSMAKYAEKFPHSTLSYGAFGQDVIKEAAKQDKPFCLSISFKAPHKPAVPDPQFDDIYKDTTFTKPENYGRENGEHMSEQSKQGRQYPRFSEWGYDNDYNNQMRIYNQQVYGIDVALGMIRDELKRQNLTSNTVIIFTSDNGFLCGSHGYGSKVLPIEESAKAPLIIFDPRSTAAGKKLRSKKLTANIDFAPTMLEIAGVEIPADMDGKSLVSLIEDPTDGGHEQIAFINTWGPTATTSLTCVTADHKYTFWWNKLENADPAEELYDLTNDPLELKNLASSSNASELLAEMRKKYEKELGLWRSQTVDYNHYEKFAVLFDRAVPYDQKQILIDQMESGKKKKNKK